MGSLQGKVIWITGASSGIGEALAYALAERGARLILSARRKEELERVRGNCSPSTHANIRTLPLDLTKTETLKLSTDAAIQVFGHVDILVNNGGISQRSFAKDTLIEVDRQIMEVNYFGAVALTKFILPHFLARKQGHFVTVSSVTGIFGTPYRSGYAASKHALHGFFDSLRAELWKDVEEKITVTMICPGFIHTPITLSAVTGDGSPLGKMDDAQYKGKPASWCAARIVNAIEKKKEEVYIGGIETLGVRFKRLLPKLFSRYMRTAKVR
ncbi:SDR family oxidoreductase [Pseudochryseolinea flava]|uniref:Short chain dehydrogenase n=1 Tax=Pseudochryseolinea flava TaxID=2059302 RepID=A0A364XWF4_9BACT|nr:SDR family oxidoreductase [Pseudochryseolinea flava]RAV98288.1 short chain dehydrogenase [Pseudochryseolinea flava]